MNDWLAAGIAVGAGVVVGSVAARIVRASLERSKVAPVRDAAAPLAGLALSIFVIIGLLVALGFVAPDELEQLGDDTIAFLPKAISALIILIAANVAATFAASAVAKALAGAGAAARFAPLLTRIAIVGGGAIVAAGQTEIDTMVVNIAVAALLASVALATALLIGLGGRQVAGELAAGRAWRTSLRTGDRIRAAIDRGRLPGASDPIVEGTVVEVHPTAVEVDSFGTTVFVPNSRLLDAVVERERPEPDGVVETSGELET